MPLYFMAFDFSPDLSFTKRVEPLYNTSPSFKHLVPLHEIITTQMKNRKSLCKVIFIYFFLVSAFGFFAGLNKFLNFLV